MANIFIGCPLYSRMIDYGAALRGLASASKDHRFRASTEGLSLIPGNCNRLWCEALNRRRAENFTWYGQLHGDIEPPAYWVDRLIEEATRYDADFVSVVIPQKVRTGPEAGRTSTVISCPGQSFQVFCALTQAQVNHPSFPDTFGIHEAADGLERLPDELRVENVPRQYLLANTGCMVCRLDRHWCEGAYFDNPNGIEKQGDEYVAVTQSEDWFFTRRIAELGGKVMATKLIRVKHWGATAFDSHEVWGMPRDAR
jgi:hypothetical protein